MCTIANYKIIYKYTYYKSKSSFYKQLYIILITYLTYYIVKLYNCKYALFIVLLNMFIVFKQQKTNKIIYNI